MTDPAPPLYSLAGKRVWVAGHRGMVGSAIVRRLEGEDCEIVTAGRETLDLTRQTEVEEWLAQARPDAIFLAAAKVGGILANSTEPAAFLYENLAVETNVIHGAQQVGVEKLLFLGSSCIYPKFSPQPIAEDDLLTGPLEPTNEWYALAKIAGIKLCQAYRRQHGCDFISAQPTNLYGPGDNFAPESSHVMPALMAKIHHAATTGAEAVTIWGSGRPRREFLHVDDCADALVHLMTRYSDAGPVNVGTGSDVTIGDLAHLIGRVAGFRGAWHFDAAKPDGTPQKRLDVSCLARLGWSPRIGLEAGVRATYDWYRAALAQGRIRA